MEENPNEEINKLADQAVNTAKTMWGVDFNYPE